MYAIQNITRKSAQLAKYIGNQHRTIVSTPPRVKISFAEKMIHGAVLYTGIMIVPMYITCKIRVYNNTINEENQ
ncbi:uncharacterized protein LOC143152537 [Ptiloglossa arizonensis]|uniref:uncharacterized protein LOC143152537 n=1 Tax=Ptiloglossa arizonensis TaxID=3350558 RepID=UPI003FA082C3